MIDLFNSLLFVILFHLILCFHNPRIFIFTVPVCFWFCFIKQNKTEIPRLRGWIPFFLPGVFSTISFYKNPSNMLKQISKHYNITSFKIFNNRWICILDNDILSKLDPDDFENVYDQEKIYFSKPLHIVDSFANFNRTINSIKVFTIKDVQTVRNSIRKIIEPQLRDNDVNLKKLVFNLVVNLVLDSVLEQDTKNSLSSKFYDSFYVLFDQFSNGENKIENKSLQLEILVNVLKLEYQRLVTTRRSIFENKPPKALQKIKQDEYMPDIIGYYLYQDDEKIVDIIHKMIISYTYYPVLACYLAILHLIRHQSTKEMLRVYLHHYVPCVISEEEIRATVMECIRYYSPAVVLKKCKRDTLIGNYDVEKDSLTLISPYLENFDATKFDHPEEFEPKRWINNNVNNLAIGNCPFKRESIDFVANIISILLRDYKFLNNTGIPYVYRDNVDLPNCSVRLSLCKSRSSM
jgi:hypothetical protein